jgi:flagellar hook-basal body complex protein FliE
MRIEPLVPDTAADRPQAGRQGFGVAESGRSASCGKDFAAAVDAVGKVFGEASSAEEAYAGGTGSLQQATYARARADVALAVAVAAVQRTAQSVQTLLNMQI